MYTYTYLLATTGLAVGFGLLILEAAEACADDGEVRPGGGADGPFKKRINIYIYVYIYIYICIYIRIYLYICIHIYVSIYIYMFVYIYINMFI
jgi:hypothetical protein